MSRLPLYSLGIAIALGTACNDPSTTPEEPTAELAKGGPNPKVVADYPSVMTIEDAGTDLVSDGKGAYQQNVCGVWSVANLWSTGTWGFQLTPAGVSIPSSQTATCTGIAPRTATMRLFVKHLSDSPHVDDPASLDGGTYSVGNLALTYTGGSLFNGPTPCYYVSRNGSLSGKGLRLDSQNFPGSNDLIREDLGNGLWHLYTAPWPNNLAYCEGSAGISYWHVVVNVQVQIQGL